MVSGSFLGFACGTTLDVSERAPEGWKNSHSNSVTSEGQECTPFSDEEVEVDILTYKQAWARLQGRAVTRRVTTRLVYFRRYMRLILWCAQSVAEK